MEIFKTRFNQGSYIDNISGKALTNSGVELKRTEKGLAAYITSGNSLSLTGLNVDAINIVTFARGIGTLRIAIGATNTDINYTSNTYQNTKSVVSLSGETTITISCTSGFVYVAMCSIYDHSLSTIELNNIASDFLKTPSLVNTKRNFYYPKPVDSSSEVGVNLGSNIIPAASSTFETDGTGYWTTNGGSKSWTVGYLTYTQSVGGANFGISALIIVAGLTYKLSFSARSQSGYTASGFSDIIISGGVGTVIKNPNLSSDWQEYEFDVTATDTTCRIYVDGLVGHTFDITNIVLRQKTGLVAHYNMIPSAGSVLTDISQNGNNGTINGALSTLEGMSFDGVDDYIDLGTQINSTLSVLNTWSICAKFKFTGIVSTGAIIGSALGASDAFSIRAVSDNVYFTLYNGALVSKSFTSLTSIVGKEINIVCTNINGVIKLYVNSVEQNGAASGSYITTVRTSIGIGTNLITWGYGGNINEIKIYTRALSLQEIKDYHNKYAKQVYLKEDFSLEKVGETLPLGWTQGTGSFEIKEADVDNTVFDINTKYLECTSNGNIKINLKEAENYVGNGYVESFKYYDGATLHDKSGVTVAALSTAESWFDYTDGVITITLTTGQSVTDIVLTKGVRV